jgi:hypothetical protein
MIDYMEKWTRIEDLIKYLYETYTKQTFNPRTEFQLLMMSDIIRHDAKELYGLDLQDPEILFIQKQINLFK